MTVLTLQAPMPVMTLTGGSTIQFEAVSPTTGAPITGVAVTEAAVYGRDVSVDTTLLEDVVPAYTVGQV